MTFLNPLFLPAGLLAAGVPIVIHLLNKRRFEQAPWAAMRFLRQSIELTQNRMKLEDLLLLALRAAMILLLAAALARPTQRFAGTGNAFGQSRVFATILLDNSYSMSQTDGVMSRFERGKQLANEVIDALPAGGSVSVFLVSDVAEKRIAQPTHDLNFARQAVATAQLSDRNTHLRGPLQEAINQTSTESGRREIYLITDAQASGFMPLEQTLRLLRGVQNDIAVHLLLAGAQEQSNLAVTDLHADADIPLVNVSQLFVARITNFGTATAAHVPVTLQIDQALPADEALIETILPGQSQTVSLRARFPNAGYHSVTASLAHDRLPADDQRSLALHVFKGVSVLLVDGATPIVPTDASTWFVQQGLLAIPPEQLRDYPLHCTRIDAAQLGATLLDQHDLVVLADVADLDPRALGNLRKFVQTGGGLLIFPGPRTRTAYYNDDFIKSGLLPARLGALRQGTASLASRQPDHPVPQLWNDPASGSLAHASFSHWYDLEPMPGSDTVLTFANDSPALVERVMGMGRILLACSTATTIWNDLPLASGGGIWPPLINRLCGWGLTGTDQLLNIRVGQPFAFPTPASWAGRSATVRRVGVGSGDPRPMRVDATLRFEDTDLAGVYSVQCEGGDPIVFAVQSDPAESDPTPLTSAQLDPLKGALTVTANSSNVRLDIDRGRLGSELWLPISAILFILGLTETVLADWFSRAK